MLTNKMALTQEEIEELFMLKDAINYNPASVHYGKMERFTELLVQDWKDKFDAATVEL